MILNAYYREWYVLPIRPGPENGFYDRVLYYHAINWCQQNMRPGTWFGTSRADNTENYIFAILFPTEEDMLYFKLASGIL